MQVQFYQLSKRENSTLQPDEGVPFDIVFKEPVNFLYPVIRLTQAAIGANLAPVMYNYAYIAKFQRYYFVSNWEYIGGCWECSLSVDVLGSWKSYITGQTVYVERAQSAYDGSIIDMQFPAKTDYTKKYAAVSSAWNGIAPSGGTYVIGLLNDQNSGVGAVTYYACTPAMIYNFITYIFGNNIFTASSITEISEGLFKGLFNPAQYIVSCMWFPESLNAFGSSTATMKIGYWDTGISANLVTALVAERFVTGTLPDHDQASARGTFLNYSPYAYYTLYCPPFGAIPIDSSIRAHGKYLRCPVYIDHITGQATMRIGVTPTQTSSGEPNIFGGEISAMFGVPIQLAQVMSDYTGAIGNMASGAIAGNILSVLSGAVQTAISALSPQVDSIGANGSFLLSAVSPGLIATFANITAASDSILGRPLMQQRVVGTLEGYIKCRDAHVMIPCTDREKTMIETYMNGGFYFE